MRNNSNYGTFQEVDQFINSSKDNLLSLIEKNKLNIDTSEFVNNYNSAHKLEQKVDAILFMLNQLSKDLKDTEKQRYYKSLVYCFKEISKRSELTTTEEPKTKLFYCSHSPEGVFYTSENADEKTPLLQQLQK
ncbi:hypothetical protein L3V86_07965 [Thiotrichales bacterium 19S11-10]|nr:hypothetical protein [Thiotrichales bacterium 19S11-10]